MNPRQFARQIGDERSRRIGEDSGGRNLRFYSAHDITGAEIVAFGQFPHHLGCAYPRGARRADQRRLYVVTEGAPFHHRLRGRAAQDIAAPSPIERPAFHVGTARKPPEMRHGHAHPARDPRQRGFEFGGIERHLSLQYAKALACTASIWRRASGPVQSPA